MLMKGKFHEEVMPTIYADNAATTKISDSVLNAMTPYMTEQYGNPSALYPVGQAAKRAVEKAREQFKAALQCREYDVVFTSGGTEADNMALRCAYDLQRAKGKRRIITSAIEHHAVLHTCQELEKQGAEVIYLPVTQEGLVNPSDLKAVIRSDTALVSIMYANNEIGTIQPIVACSKIAHEHGVLFHTDAVQSVGHIPISLDKSDIDLLSFSAHKFYGPKGVGGLIHKVKELRPFIYGGGQERGMRSGTENVAGIVGSGQSIEDAVLHMEKNTEHVDTITHSLLLRLMKIPGARLNGAMMQRQRLPGHLSISFDGVEGEAIVLWLGQKNICVSAGSACSAGSSSGSHVLKAIGAKSTDAVRITLGNLNTQEDVDMIADAIEDAVNKLR